MTRVACLFGLIALVVLGVFIRHVDGLTAILFSFVGMPALGLAVVIHVIQRWRAGAFAFMQPPSHPKEGR